MPPAMPKMPDRKEVPTMVMHTATVTSGIMAAASGAVMRRLWHRRKLSYAAVSIRFLNGNLFIRLL
jgi:hypothetical protein